MKAWVLHDVGDIRYEEVPIPEPAAGEVLIRVGATGICGSDIPRIYDTGAHKMPLIPGHEFSGEVAGTGEGVDKSWNDKRVGVFPLIPCGKCSQCRNRRYELCRDYDYIGSRRDGAFAEYVTVPAANLIELPDKVSFEETAMLEPMAVAVHAIRRVMGIGRTGNMLDGNDVSKDHDVRIAVYGLGTIGMFITMFLKAAGYDNLMLIGNKDSQREKIISMGIAEDCYYDNSIEKDHCKIQDREERSVDKTETAAQKIKDIGGADIVFECVGRTQTCVGAIDIAAPMGKVMLVGNPYSDMTLPRNTYWKILRNQLTVMGTWNSSFARNPDDDWHYVLDHLVSGLIDPVCFISHQFSLKDLKVGFDIIHEKSEEYGKVIMVNKH